MTAHSQPSTVTQDVESANSPETVELRDADNEVPEEVSGYEVVQLRLTETAGAQAEVRLQSFDNGTATVRDEVVVSVPADSSTTLGSDHGASVLTVQRGNQIRVTTTSDVETTVYLAGIDL